MTSICQRCDRDFYVGDELENSEWCNPCAQEIAAESVAAVAVERERILTAIEAEFHAGRTCTRQRLAVVIAKLREGSK